MLTPLFIRQIYANEIDIYKVRNVHPINGRLCDQLILTIGIIVEQLNRSISAPPGPTVSDTN